MMTKENDMRMRCDCGWEGPDEDLEEVQTFAGNREKPSECEYKCPSCITPFEDLEEVPLCVKCRDVHVQEEGDTCGACVAEECDPSNFAQGCVNEVQERHSCPFEAEVRENYETYCSCCKVCEEKCARCI